MLCRFLFRRLSRHSQTWLLGRVMGLLLFLPMDSPRGCGRPPKSGGLKWGPGHPSECGGVKWGPGHPPRSVGPNCGGLVKRGRGRPKDVVASFPAVSQVRKGPGRPPKPINVVGILATPGAVSGGAEPVAGKRRRRPLRAGSAYAGQPMKLKLTM